MEKYKVLVVDDSSLMRHLIVELLEQDPKFYVAGTARNGQEALNRIIELQPDLVTMDLEMPEMDGLTALEHIMKYYPVPVVMLNSRATEGSSFAIEALELGAVDYFDKDMLFQNPVNLMIEEDFLFRCKAAMRNKESFRKKGISGSKEQAVQVLIDSMTYCMMIEEDLRYAQEELGKAIRQQNGLIMKFKEDKGRFVHTFCDGNLLNRLGLTSQEIIGRELHAFFSKEVAEYTLPFYQRAWAGEDMVSYETDWHGLNYLTVLRSINRRSQVNEVISITMEITEQKYMEERMKHLANQDHLTGLPNRQFLGRLMHKTIEAAGLENKKISVLFINLDHFKLINDTLGHDTGDRILQAVARRLKRCVKADSILARVGGDEFIHITMETMDDALIQLSKQIMDAIKQPFSVMENEINITASIGISQFSEDNPDAESLMKNANIALNFAKEQGRNNLQFYNPKLNEKLHKRMQIEKHLRKALERNEFILHYQPQVDIHTSQVVGLETLIRWDSPELGFVSPLDFITVAEETGLILEIGQWVIKEACRNNKAWQNAGLPNMIVTVNLSSRQFYDKRLEEMIQCTLNDTGLAPEFLELEITESITMDVKVALITLKGLKKMGLKIAMDDFGTGYSSLSYLKEFPIDVLKIDQSFVKDIVTSSVNAAIVNTIITMASNLKLKVIAEGVETEEALQLLKDYGCNTVQGYLYSPPIAAEQVEGLIRVLEQKGRLLLT